MIRGILLVLLLLTVSNLSAQEEELETLIEELSESDEANMDQDEWIQQLHHLQNNPIRINRADRNELASVVFLNEFQIEQLLLYRKLLGELISVYELQAIPGWDNETIRRVLPYITIEDGKLNTSVEVVLTEGNGYLVAQTASVFPRAKGYSSVNGKEPAYWGNPWRYQLRMRYQYKQLVQYGFTLEKDPGEPLWYPGKGVDFQSFHCQFRHIRKLETLVLGDFVVNMGQGLLQWQGMAFGKGSNVMGIKRHGPPIRAYSGAGEYNFHRGMGLTVSSGSVGYSAYVSTRSLTATVEEAEPDRLITSISQSGLHRTETERSKRNAIRQYSAGVGITFTYNRFRFGVNGVGTNLSGAIEEKDDYRIFGISGTKWAGASTDFSFTGRKGFWFGEAAVDKRGAPAALLGCLMVPHSSLEWAVLLRAIDPKYQSWNGNAFTAASAPSNETGIYSGWRWYVARRVQVDGYADFYRWPWLRYRVSAPSYGADYLLKISGRSRKTTWSVQHRYGNRPTDLTDSFRFATPGLTRTSRWRFAGEHQLANGVQIRMRWELVRILDELSEQRNGNLWYAEFRIPLPRPRVRLDLRLQYFETDGYTARIYAAEREVLFHQSAPAYFGRGWKTYLMLQYSWKKQLKFWLRAARTVTPGVAAIGSGQDEIAGGSKTELRFQVQWLFGKSGGK